MKVSPMMQQYLDIKKQYKGDKRRINLLLKASGGSLVVKKNAATVIKGIRKTSTRMLTAISATNQTEPVYLRQ